MVIYILFSQLLAIYYLKYLMVHKYCFCSQSIEYDYICVFNVVVYPLSLPSSSSCLFSHERLWIFQIFSNLCQFNHVLENSIYFCSFCDMTNLVTYFGRYIATHRMGIKLNTIYLLLYFWLIGQYQKKIAYPFISPDSWF